MNTPVNGPMMLKGRATINVVRKRPPAVDWLLGENTTEAISAAWNNPSPACEHSRTAKSLRKSCDRNASRVRAMLPGAVIRTA
ncbi:MAG: hypothetical protein QOG88_1340 [Actinomycetota bacterium]|nr:hypothetical protein [Actinomycetota bacterium]